MFVWLLTFVCFDGVEDPYIRIYICIIYIYICIFMSRTTNTCFIRDVVGYLVLLLFVQNFSFDIYI